MCQHTHINKSSYVHTYSSYTSYTQLYHHYDTMYEKTRVSISSAQVTTWHSQILRKSTIYATIMVHHSKTQTDAIYLDVQKSSIAWSFGISS